MELAADSVETRRGSQRLVTKMAGRDFRSWKDTASRQPKIAILSGCFVFAIGLAKVTAIVPETSRHLD